ncbi:hypothetical protein C1669_29120, partial [Klebsiella pneumoniae]|uniref:integrase core domain-containing protein n=1 Tax=Klebsiella pneumoniae TaxID=573 RepID=UPI000D48E77C
KSLKLKGLSPVEYRTQALRAAKYEPSNYMGSVQQRRRARTAGTEPILCRVAAAPYPAYVRTTCR